MDTAVDLSKNQEVKFGGCFADFTGFCRAKKFAQFFEAFVELECQQFGKLKSVSKGTRVILRYLM
jgi:hypothetical protein